MTQNSTTRITEKEKNLLGRGILEKRGEGQNKSRVGKLTQKGRGSRSSWGEEHTGGGRQGAKAKTGKETPWKGGNRKGLEKKGPHGAKREGGQKKKKEVEKRRGVGFWT